MINFLCTSPKPQVKYTDAIYNEIDLLRKEFDGNVLSLYPFTNPSSRFPIELYGISKIKGIIQNERQNKLNHIYSGGLFFMPIIYFLSKPIIYTVAAGLVDNFRLPPKNYLKKIAKFIVSNERDRAKLQAKGINNAEIIKPSIDIKPFERNPLILSEHHPLKLVLASAPWELKQFDTKCIRMLLSTIKEIDNISLTLLWRGLYVNEIKNLIEKYQVKNKVTLMNEFKNINQILKEHHGAILLAKDGAIVKSYPHSLIESIVCGKPIITSIEIPIADFVNNKKCGYVVDQLDKQSLVSKIKEFRDNYNEIRSATLDISPDIFANENKMESYRLIYNQVI